ncbi:MAG: molybdopterin-dependent oxidoreductase [Actinobacteria bacterium]|nr:molybdopterin-dependent oxidoreductase [Actinomycetota bacterium]
MGGAGGRGRRSAPADLIRLEGQVFTGEFAPPTDPLASQKEDPVTHYAYGFATQVVLMDEVGRVAKVVAAHDVGRVINPVLLEGQVEGAIVMGLGYALREEFQVKYCVPATDSFRSLRLLKSTEIPEIELHFIERGVRGGDQGEDRGAAENGPPDRGLAASFGAKGIGEIACIPTAPAVAAARYRLTGKRCFELPLP